MYFNTLEYALFFVVTFFLAKVTARPGLVVLCASVLFYVVAG